MKEPSSWIVIPAYNEEKRLEDTLLATKKFSSNIVVVDDGSQDTTITIAKKHTSHVLRHVINLGKGNAVKTGCDYALRRGATVLVLMDADGQHEPRDITPMITQLQEKQSDIVFSYRKRDNNMPAILKFGNWFINRTTRLLFSITLHDTQCGFRVFTKEAYRRVRWSASGYGMESEMIARAGQHKLRYSEYPIRTIYHDTYKGTTPLHGCSIVIDMIWWRLTL